MVKKKKQTKLDEKYRPRYLKDVLGNKYIIDKLKDMVKSKNIPHLLFAGHAGLGKTTSAFAICNELYGINNKKLNVLELNASDERGIDVIRHKVKEFVKYFNPDNEFINNNTEINFCIVILDEAEALTPQAQKALKRIMEEFAHKARFIIITNTLKDIKDPIQSRCVVMKFKPIKNSEIIKRIDYVCKKENFKLAEDAKKYIIEQSNGDMRRVLNTLELAKVQSLHSDLVTIDFFQKTMVSNKQYKRLLELSLQKKIKEAYSYYINMLKNGIELNDIISQINEIIIDIEKIPNLMKAGIILAGIESIKLLLNGGNSINSGLGYIAELSVISTKYKPNKNKGGKK